MKRYETFFVFLGLITALRLPAQTRIWPVVQSGHQSHTFTNATGNADTPFLAFIRDTKGVPIYKLECHNGNYEDEAEISFSGDFQCALFGVKGKKRTTENLLTVNNKDEQSTDWWNRGRMLSAQLRGACTGYPEYESLRHFKLRGMLIKFQFSGLEWGKLDAQNNPELTKFTFDFSVIQDKGAQSSEAEAIKGPKPPEPCY